jgi:thiol:disulfide interchange protein
MQPIVNGLETEFRGQIAFERRNANTETGRATMATYGLRAHPSYVIVAPDGKQLWSFMGSMTADSLRTQLQNYSKGVP